MSELNFSIQMATDDELNRVVAGCFLITDRVIKCREDYVARYAASIDKEILVATIAELNERKK